MSKYTSIAVAALLLCLSCLFGTGTGDGDQPDQTTVLGTLNSFVDVWNSGDVEVYEDLLDEDFTFHFDPADAEDDDIPDEWYYDDEVGAYTDIFAALGEGNVAAWLDLSGVSEPGGDEDTCTVNGVPYLVLFIQGNDSYRAEAHLDMTLAKSGGQWFITEWWDRVSWRLPGIWETTWGAVKAIYGGGNDG